MRLDSATEMTESRYKTDCINVGLEYRKKRGVGGRIIE